MAEINPDPDFKSKIVDADDELKNRLNSVAFHAGDDHDQKQQRANDTMAATIAVKQATKWITPAEERKVKAIQAGQVDKQTATKPKEKGKWSIVKDKGNILLRFWSL